MEVFVESNFVLELALEQEEAKHCRQILAAAEAQRIALHVPHVALMEVFLALGNRGQERRGHLEYLRREIRQYRREAAQDSLDGDELERMVNSLLAERTAAQTERLFSLVGRLLAVAAGCPLSANILTEAPQVQKRHGLTPPDALVYASVLAGLRLLPATDPKMFVSRNKGDFNKPDIIQELRNHSCGLLFDFGSVAGRLRL